MCHRWLLLESVVGTSTDRPTNPYGLDTVEFTMQAAANNSQTTARVFAHGVNSTMALQPEQGALQFVQVRSVQTMLLKHFWIVVCLQCYTVYLKSKLQNLKFSLCALPI